jgi:cytochrome c peroxidase
MTRPSRRTLVVLGLLVVGLLLVLVPVALRPGDTSTVSRSDPHRATTLSRSQMARLLDAVATVARSKSKAELVAEGQQLFRSASVAKDGESCQGCHTNGGANPDLGTVPHPQGPGDFTGRRDPPSLWGVSQTAPYFWVGNVPTLEGTVTATINAHFRTGTSQPTAKTAEQAAAIVAYLDTIEPPITPFDTGTMSPAAVRGEALFRGKADCIACHAGPLFTDNRLHNTNVPQLPGATDPGAPIPVGAFNTPTLRDARNTGPYMHNGVFTTLDQVVRFYNSQSSVAPLGLTDAEVGDLVAYLDAL